MELKTPAISQDKKLGQSKVVSKLNLVTQNSASGTNRAEEPNFSKRNFRLKHLGSKPDHDSEFEPLSTQHPRTAAQSDLLPLELDISLAKKQTSTLTQLQTDRFLSTTRARHVASPLHISRSPDQLYTTRNYTSTSNLSQGEYSVKDFYLTSRAATKTFSFKKMRPPTVVATEFNHSQEFNPSEKLTNLSQHKAQTGFAATEPDLSEKVKLGNFYEGLPPSIRQFFADKKDFLKIFDDYNVATFCLEEVITKVKCYRVELGLLLEKVADTHKKLFEKTIDASLKLFKHQEMIIERKLGEIKENLKKIEFEKLELEMKNQNFKELLQISESSSRMQAMNIEKLQTEIKISHELRKRDLTTRLEEKMDEKMRENGNLFGDPQDRGGNNKGYSERLQDDVANLQGFFEELDREQNNKARIIKDMSNHLKATLKKIKYDASTQVDEGELAWTASNLGNFSSNTANNTDFAGMESAAVNVETKLKKQVSATDALPGVDPINVLKIKDKEVKASIEQESDAKKKSANVITLNQAQNMLQEFENNWNMPLNLIIFLENVTKTGETAKVLPWAYFKKIIFDIYNDRIKNKTEIENSLINTFVPLNEYICLFFLKKFHVRRVAELKLLEFLVSLKYYVKIWPRAQLFAYMCNITGVNKLREAQDPINMNEYDIYMQNFVLYAYEHIVADQGSLVEHSEGTTWVVKEKLEEITENVLVFLTPTYRKRFLSDLQMQYRFIGEGPDKEAEGIDVDKLLFICIEQYVEAKRKNIKAMTKYFYKNSQEYERIVSIEDFASYLQEVNEVEISVAGQVYPKDITTARAFLYALTSGKNGYAVTFKQFIASMVRFGMDCPFPFISFGSDDQKQRDYLAASASSDLFKRKNQLMMQKRKGGMLYSSEKKKFGSFLRSGSEFGKEGDTDSPVRPTEGKESKGGHKTNMDIKSANGVKLDSASALFAQHFSILRELRNYCKDFTEMVESGDQEFEAMLKSFRQIAQILDSGCEFLSFPINIH